MKLRKTSLILALAVFSLFLISSLTVAQITPYSNNSITISTSTTGPVSGNTTIPTGTDPVDIENNQVFIDNIVTIGGSVYGGITRGLGDVLDNNVTITSNGQLGGAIYGGFIGNSSSSATVSNNNVTVNGKVTGTGIIYGGNTAGAGDVYQNIVIITSGGSVFMVYGGYSWDSGTSGKISENKVEIYGEVRGSVYGGVGSGSGAVTQNTIIIEDGGSVDSNVIGGINTAGAGNVADNIVTIAYGGTAKGAIFGGRIDNTSSAGKVEKNIIRQPLKIAEHYCLIC